jgi:hypothetical protein
MQVPFMFRTNQPTFFVLLCVVASFIGQGAIAEMLPGPKLCAQRDLEVVILIEDHGAANDVAPERLAKAFLAQLDARAACSKSHVPEGIALYDNIISSLGSTQVGSMR